MSKKETIEEAAERFSELQEATYTSQHKITYKHGFVDGAKYKEDEIKVYLVHHKQEFKHFQNMGNNELMNYHEGIVFFIENVLKIKL
jgi:hypothetical protein